MTARWIDTNNPVLTPGVWQHIAATFDLATQDLKLYVNGVQVPATLFGTGPITSIFESISPVRLGAAVDGNGNLSGFWNGLVDEVELFSRALSASEIQSIVNAGSAGKCKPTVGRFVYVVNDQSSRVSGYLADAATGSLAPLPGSPFSTGPTPYAVAVDPMGRFAYVANGAGQSVSAYTIDASTGTLVQIQGSPFQAGQIPNSVAVDPSGRFVYVANEFSLDVDGYRIDPSTGGLTPIVGSPFPAGNNPAGITIDPTGHFLYVVNCGTTSCGSVGPGTISAYTIDPATGALTSVVGSPFSAGNNAFAIAIDPLGRVAYVAHATDNAGISAFAINPTTGGLTEIAGSPFPNSSQTASVAVERTGRFAYFTNGNGSSVAAFAINMTTGALTPVSGSPFPAGTAPYGVIAEPGGRYLYVANQSSNSVSGYAIGATGALIPVPGSPFASIARPSYLAVATGNTTLKIPTINWVSPAPIVYGTALTSAQLNAAASFNGSPVAGTFTYTPAAGTVLSAGLQTLSVLFTPTDSTTYTATTAVVTLTVTQASPVVTVTGGTFTYSGTPHPAVATATGVGGGAVAGSFTFTYTPGGPAPPVIAGTYAVAATFTSSDPNYTNASGNTTIGILPATPVVTVSGGTFPYTGNPRPATATATGVSGLPVAGSFSVTYTPGGTSAPVNVGTYSVMATFVTSDPNYTNATGAGTIVISASQTFSDSFNRPDGPVGNGWSPWGNGAVIAGGQLETFGQANVAGGVSRSLPVTFPVTFSFDFRTMSPNDGGWQIGFNINTVFGANEFALYQYVGDQPLCYQYQSSSGRQAQCVAVVAGQEKYATAAFAHIVGTILPNLSASTTITYADGTSVTIATPAPSGAIVAPQGPLLILGNTNATLGPHFFANFSLSARGELRYDASVGTLPQAQGFTYSGDGGNPSPTVSGGALQENTTAGAQYWSDANPLIDLSGHLVLSANLHIITSNYVPNIGTGTREGYYLYAEDSRGSYSIGLADSGFNINSTSVPNQPLTPYPYPITDTFHSYRLVIDNNRGTFFIDGTPVATGISPVAGAMPRMYFGAAAGASRSVTELRTLCYGTDTAACPVSGTTPILISNPGFEADVLTCGGGPGCFDLGVIPNWQPTGPASTFKPSTGVGGEFPGGIPEGVNVAALGNSDGIGQISQTLGATLQANTVYTLTLSVGQRADSPFAGYTAALLAGGVTLASDSSLIPAPGTFLIDVIVFSSGPNPAQLGQPLAISVRSSAPGGQVDVDKISLTASSGAGKLTPTINWQTPAAISYGTALSGTQLNATASFNGSPVPGTFMYTPPAGTVLSAGSRTLSVVFTPTDTVTYTTATATTTLAVAPATPVVTLTSGTFVYTGTPHPAMAAATGVGGAPVAGSFTFTYTPGGTTAPVNVGTYAVTATFTSSDPNYTNAVGNATSITITPAAPTVTVTGGTFAYTGNPHPALATVTGIGGATVAGTLTVTYTPGGTPPPVNAGTYAVIAAFTSSDPNYTNATGNTAIVINPAVPTVAVVGGTFAFDGNPHPAVATVAGVGGVPVRGTVSITYVPGGSAIPVSAGTYAVTATFASGDPNYANASGTGSLTITGLSPTVTVIGGTFTFDGNPHPATAVATGLGGVPVSGTFSFSYAPGGSSPPILAGSYLVTAVFTSNDPSYGNGRSTGAIIVSPSAPPALISVATDQPVYRRGQPVAITGTLTTLGGTGISNVAVVVQVSLNGTTRTLNPFTDARGSFQTTFQPAATDGGTFAISAVTTYGGLTQMATTTFRIIGFVLSPGLVTQDQVMGSTTAVPVNLQNVGASALNSVSYSVTVLPAGQLTATISQSTTSLAPGAAITLPVELTTPAGNPPPTPVSVQVSISATDPASGLTDQETSSFAITLRPAVSTPVLTPATLSVGTNPGKNLIRRFIVQNAGYVPFANGTVTLQDPVTYNWVSFGNADLGNLAPGDSHEFQVYINPPPTLALGSYSVLFNVSGGSVPLQGTLNVAVTQSTLGAATFVVSDDIGTKVNGATVTLYGAGGQFQGVSGVDGQAALTGIPAGVYTFVVAAASHDPASGSVTVTPNATASVPVILSYDVVQLTFTVTPTTIVDQYNVTLYVTYSTTLPKPALQVVPYSLDFAFFPEDAPNGKYACSLSITNSHPTAPVRNVTVDTSQVDVTQPNGQRIHVQFADGSTLYQVGSIAAKGTSVVPCYATLDGGSVPTHSAGVILAQGNYDFSLDGQVLQGTTTTQVPVSYTRPPELFYDPVPFIYDKRTDPANPVLKYDAGSYVYKVKSNRAVGIDMLKPSGAGFTGHNLAAFTDTVGGSTSLNVITANTANVFWHTDFDSQKQSLVGAGDITTYDISTYDTGNITLEQALNAQIARNPDQVINRPTYLGFEGQWRDSSTPTGYLVPVKITTITPNAVIIPRPPASARGGDCLNPEDPLCKDPLPDFQPPVQTQDGQILLAIDQKIRLERQAFNAMLGIGAQAVLSNTVASIQIRDAGGNDASSKFFVLVTSDPLGATRGGTVSGQARVSWQLIPMASAGGTAAAGTQYQVTATLNYVVAGTGKTAATHPVTITVLPSPKLTVAYTLPFVVMPGKDAKIRVTVQNIGAGTARNFSVQSAQPRVVSSMPAYPIDPFSETLGPIVNFSLTGSSSTADGKGFQAGNLTINFGDVAPGATVSGYWTLRVSQKGFFIDVTSTFSQTDYQGVQLDPLVLPPTTALVPAIGGSVTTGSGQAIPGLTVRLSQAGVSVASDQTDFSGVYYIPDLAAGNYTEDVVDLTGAVLATKSITVLADQGTNFINFVLQTYDPTQALVVVNSDPPGASFTADGIAYTTPRTFQWAVGSNHTLGASSSVTGVAQTQATASTNLAPASLVFVGWNNGETSPTQTITVGPLGATVTPIYLSSDIVNRYTRTQLTTDPVDHKWPSTNTLGDLVWSQKDQAGYWQVFKQVASSGSRSQLTTDAHNHERPRIGDDGTVAWFQDGTGGGLGYAIMRLDPGATAPSVVEFSSRSRPECNPLTGECFTPQERASGKTFGMSSTDARTISFYTFFDTGQPLYRRFSVSGIGQLQGPFGPGDFRGYDSPDINKQLGLVYSSDSFPAIYFATTTAPFRTSFIDNGQYPHISDGAPPELAYIKVRYDTGPDGRPVPNANDVTHWTGSDGAQWVALGLWAGIRGTGRDARIVYECVNNRLSQICEARPRQQTELVDPVSELLDPSGNQVTGDRSLLAQKGRSVKGVATDGVARLVVRFSSPASGSVTFSLVDVNGNPLDANKENGALQNLDGSAVGNTITVSTDAVSQGDMAFGVFLAPSQFARQSQPGDVTQASRQVFIATQFSSTAGDSIDFGRTAVMLVRPLVFMVHGIWSSPRTWDKFGVLARGANEGGDPRFYIQRADYETYNSQSFGLNGPIIQKVYFDLQSGLALFKQAQNVAAVQVDAVTHSMGGPVVRTMALTPTFTSDVAYPTFGRGPIRKLITIAGVHKGTPMAYFIRPSQVGSTCLADIFSWFGNNVTQGAVDALKPDSPEIVAINQTSTPFPAHTIVGVTDDLAALAVAGWFNGIGQTLCPAQWVTMDLPTIFANQPNDLLVARDSQIGFDVPPVVFSEADLVVHSKPFDQFTRPFPRQYETENAGIADRVVQLLDIDGDDSNWWGPLPR